MAAVRLILCVAAIAIADDVYGQTGPQFSQVREGLYLARYGDQTSIVFVAPEGIALANPLSVSGGLWLRDQLAARFPGRPVRYIIYTSGAFERIAGAAAFPQATVVAHAQLNAEIVSAARTLPATVAAHDRNGDGRLDRSEWAGSDMAASLSAADINKDGILTSREAWRLGRFAHTHFRERITLTIGGSRIEVTSPGDTASSPALFFPEQRAAYISTAHVLGPSGLQFGDANPREVLAWLRIVAAWPFDMLVTDRGETVSRAAFDDMLRAAEHVYATAIEAYARGASAAGAATSPSLQRDAGKAPEADRLANMEAIFRVMRVTRTELQAAGLVRWMQPNRAYCEGYDTCVSGGEVTGGSGGLRIAMSRTGVILEAAFDDQFLSERQGFFDDEAYAQRIGRGSLLFRYGSNRPTSRSIELLAGPTVLVADRRGLMRVKQAVAPFGGRHQISEREIVVAPTVGVNLVLPLSRAISVIVPIRATVIAHQSAARWPGRIDAHAGLGFSVRMTQRVR